MKYTDEQRQRAVDLYTEHGTAEASRQTGITGRTIIRWAKDAGAVSRDMTKKTAAATEALQGRNEERRERVRYLLLERTEHLLEAVTGDDPNGARNLAVAIGVLIDKYRLELGEATDRISTVTEDIDQELMRLAAELGRGQPAPQ